MYILPNKTNKLYVISPYKEEYIYIITNSLFALIFLTEVTYNGIIEELRKVVGSRPLNLAGVAVAVFNEQGQIKETFLKASFSLHFCM